VLVVDDAPDVRLITRAVLESEGMTVHEAADGQGALDAVAAQRPAVVLLDIEMPGMNGLEVMARLRRTDADLPIILVSGRSTQDDRVLGLELGADDYVVKPFCGREMAARVRSVLRRSVRECAVDELAAGPLVIRTAERRVLLDGRTIELTPKEFDLLAFLVAAAPGRVFSREELLREVWGSSAEWQDRATVTEHIRRLRRHIETDASRPTLLQTVRGIGYRFDPRPAA
jgi:DNA-binding response OmpR family regulator